MLFCPLRCLKKKKKKKRDVVLNLVLNTVSIKGKASPKKSLKNKKVHAFKLKNMYCKHYVIIKLQKTEYSDWPQGIHTTPEFCLQNSKFYPQK